MKHIATSLMLASFAAACAADDLDGRVLGSDGWVAWQVPMVADVEAPCCFNIRRGQAVDTGCDLDARGWSFGSDSRHPRRDDTLSVYVHVSGHAIDEVRAVAASCPVSSRTPIRDLGAVDAGESIDTLAAGAGNGHARDDDGFLAAIGYHADPAATALLAKFTGAGHSLERRGQALFWLGQLRGAPGVQAIEHSMAGEPDADVREKAIFALSQARSGDAYPRVLDIARSDASEHVRGQALFWLAQMGDARAAGDILAVLAAERSADAREQAVFALSQLEDGRADDGLIAVLRGNYPRDAKKQALFWLGQSGSPRAIEALDAVLASH